MKTITLSKGEHLWQEGHEAVELGILEAGKLGIEIRGRRVGVFFPRAAVGEAALLSRPGEELARTASIVALEAGTRVVLYGTSEVQEAYDRRDFAVPAVVQKTLVAQICKNCVLVASANPDVPMIATVVKGLGQGLSAFAGEFHPAATWALHLDDLRFLCSLRDFTDELWDHCYGCDEAAVVERASQLVRHLYPAGDLGVTMSSFILAEREAILGG